MTRIALVAAFALALAACSRDEPEPVGNALNADMIDTGAVNETVLPPPPPPPLEDNVANAAPPAPVEEPIDEPAQLEDDAESTGMTSRVDRSEEAEETAANETAGE